MSKKLPMKEKDELVSSLYLELSVDHGEPVSLRPLVTETLETSFQGNMDIIKQLTSQNKELLSLLLETPKERHRSQSLSKALRAAKHTHQDTEVLDLELSKLQEEIAASLEEPSFAESMRVESDDEGKVSPETMSPKSNLLIENQMLKKELVEAEARCVLLKQKAGNIGETNETKLMSEQIREKNRQLNELTAERGNIAAYLDKLRRSNHKMETQLRAQEGLKEKIRSLNLLYTKREEVVENMKTELHKQRLKAQTIVREAKSEKYAYLKAISTLTEQLRRLSEGGAKVEFELPKEIDSAMKSQTAALEEKILELKEEIQQKDKQIDKLEDLAIEKEEKLEEANLHVRDLQKDLEQKISNIQKAESVNLELTKTGLSKDENANLLFNQLETLKNDKDLLEKQYAQTKENLDKFSEENDSLKKELKDKTERIEVLEKAIEEKDREADLEMTNIIQELGVLDSPDKSFGKIKLETQKLVRKMNEKNETLQELYSQNYKLSSDLSSFKASAEQEKTELSQQIQGLNSNLTEKEKECVQKSEELNANNLEKESLQKLVKDKDQEIQAHKNESGGKILALENTIAQLQGKNEESPKKKSSKKNEEEKKEEKKSSRKSKKDEDAGEEKKGKKGKKDDANEEEKEKKGKKSKKNDEEEKKSKKKNEGEAEEKKTSRKSKKNEGEEEKKGKKTPRAKDGEEKKKSSKSKNEGEEEKSPSKSKSKKA